MNLKELADGNEIPMLGLGTYQLTGSSGKSAIIHALKTGYRHLDTAAMYGNEEQVGRAVREVDIKREDIFITTKIWRSDLGKKNTRMGFEDSLGKLGMDYLDLYLIHWPGIEKEPRLETWEYMQEQRDEGKIKSIGVSNFSISQLQEISDFSGEWPVMNQIHFSPFRHDMELLNYCKSKNIAVTAYTPLEKAQRLGHPMLQELAEKYDHTPAQIMLRWSIEKDVIVIPKSSTPSRIDENKQIFDFELSEEDVNRLDDIKDA